VAVSETFEVAIEAQPVANGELYATEAPAEADQPQEEAGNTQAHKAVAGE
jgi:hypothetical protein